MPAEGETLDSICGGRVEILQRVHGYRFNLDPLLLAHFVAERGPCRGATIDLGTGSGIIPIVLARKFDEDSLTALELQPSLYALAERNVQRNRCEDRISLALGDLRAVDEKFPRASFGRVVCNPPFGKRLQGRVNPNEEKAIARHEVEVRLKDVADAASYLLEPRGSIAIVYPAARLGEAIACFREHKLEPKRLRLVHPRAGRPANRVLLEAVKGARSGAVVPPPLLIHGPTGADFTDEVNSMLS